MNKLLLKNEHLHAVTIVFAPILNITSEELNSLLSGIKDESMLLIEDTIINSSLETIFLKFILDKKLEKHFRTSFIKNLKINTDLQKAQFLNISHEIIDIQQIFHENKIDAIFLKGVFMSFYVYQNSQDRTMNDIDILIEENKIVEIYNLLISNGYVHENGKYVYEDNELQEIIKKSHQLPNLISPNNISIELHSRITKQRDFNDCPFLDNFLNENKKYNLLGTKIRLPNHLDAACHQIEHAIVHSKLCNQARAIYDIHFLINKYNLNWHDLISHTSNPHIKKCIILFSRIYDFIFEDVHINLSHFKQEDIETIIFIMIQNNKILKSNLVNISYNNYSIPRKIKAFMNLFFPSKLYLIQKYQINNSSYLKIYFYMFINFFTIIKNNFYQILLIFFSKKNYKDNLKMHKKVENFINAE